MALPPEFTPEFVPEYVFDGEPPAGEAWDVVPGVKWLRMPLPFKLNHINLWMLEDGDGWTLVDTGIDTEETRQAWESVFAKTLDGKPVKRLIVTHYHPDHIGLAGWLVEKFNIPLWMPYTEWTTGRMQAAETLESARGAFHDFYKAAGFEGERLAQVDARVGRYGSRISPIPASIRRIRQADEIEIGGHIWRVIEGNGHSPEHACLYCADMGLLVSGDQILPKISPNVSVWPAEPDADPLAEFLASLERFRPLPSTTLVLPSHNWPFLGLLERLNDLRDHHMERLDAAEAACAGPDGATGVAVLEALFRRELDSHQMFFAIGESLAHLHHLVTLGRVRRETDARGVHRFFATARAPVAQ